MEVVSGLHYAERIRDAKVYLWLDGDRTVLIDAAMPGRAPAIWKALAAVGRSPQSVDQIWITHGDVDHMGSVAALKSGSGAQVVAHRDDVAVIEGQAQRELGQTAQRRSFRLLSDLLLNRLFRYEPVTVDRAVVDGDRLGDWQVVHVPGHTAGSVCFYHAGRKMAIVGDAINHRRGRLGAPPPLFSPDMEQARASIQRIAALDIEVCCFGHGPPLIGDAQARLRAFADSV